MASSHPSPPSFCLLSEKWIPVLDQQGQSSEVSLRDLLFRAPEYTRIDAVSPLITIALYRLILAILYRALGSFTLKDVTKWFDSGFPKEKLEEYFQRYRTRFDLFGETPFLQVTDLHTDPAFKPEWSQDHWTRLASELGSANTTLLFNDAKRLPGETRTDATTPAEAARRLVTQQTFSLGGLMKRNISSCKAGPVSSAAITLALGKNLLQTLCLNLVPDHHHTDEPAFWEQEPLKAREVRKILDAGTSLLPKGLAQLYVPQTRIVHLHPELNEQGEWCVRHISFAAGLPLSDTIAESGHTLDPMVAVRVTSSKKAPYTSQKLSRKYLGWRDLGALLPEPQNKSAVLDKKGYPVVTLVGTPPLVLEHARAVLKASRLLRAWDDVVLPICVIGQMHDKSKISKIFAIRQEEYTLPHVFVEDEDSAQRFADDIETVLGDAKQVAGGLNSAVHKLVYESLAHGRDISVDKDDVNKIINSIEAEGLFWSRLETPFRQYLAEVDTDPAQAKQAWQKALKDAAKQAWQAALTGMGQNARSLRAATLAERLLLAAIRSLPQGDAL